MKREYKVGSKVLVKVNNRIRKGKILTIPNKQGDFFNIDFGSGDVYGIVKKRILK